jgi:ABC-type nitrate/sulfonate/bicarbonate transport system substrate-binding protein
MMAGSRAALRVCSFQGLQNLPAAVALRRGYFDDAGLDVALSFTNSSAQQLAALASGGYDLVHTAPDNVVNCDTNPAAFGLDPALAPRLVMLMGGSNGPLSVYARRGVTDASELRGQAVGVDNPTSGFALVLRDLLARAGLELDRDYRMIATGGTGKRAHGLLAGEFAATILYAPFDLLVAEAGCQRIAVSSETYPAYASQALAATDAWVAGHGDLVARYIGGSLRALRWIYEPAARSAVEALLVAEPALGLAGLDPAHAYAAFTHPRDGFGERAALDRAGLSQVIALRARYGAPIIPLGESESYLDLRWYEQAAAEAPGSQA